MRQGDYGIWAAITVASVFLNEEKRHYAALDNARLWSRFYPVHSKVLHRVWEYFQARLAFTLAMFHLLVEWYGLPANEEGFVPLSIAEFGL